MSDSNAKRQEHPKVQQWLEDFDVIERAACDLVTNHYIYKQLRRIIANNATARQPSSFHAWISSNYDAASVMAVRRLADPSRSAKSFRRLLQEIQNDSTLISLERHINSWRETYPDWDDQTVVSSAKEGFESWCGPGATYLPRDQVNKDIERLQQATTTIRDYADKRVAHYDKEEFSEMVTYGELEDAITSIEKLVIRYGLLLKHSTPSPLLPIWQYNWKQIFREAWLPKQQEFSEQDQA